MHPKKRLGQNFLINPIISQRILSRLKEEDEFVLEIGPGMGFLTKALLQNPFVKSVLAIEKDTDMHIYIEKLQADQKEFNILYEDVLDVNFYDIRFRFFSENQKIAMVSNLPYNIGTVIVMNFLKQIDCFSKAILMLQKEVVDRIVSAPKKSSYGRLSVIAQVLCDVELVTTVSAENFRPKPKVCSAVVSLIPKKHIPNQKVISMIENVCFFAFQNRRKKLLNNIAKMKNPIIHKVFNEHITPNARIEELSPSKICEICTKIIDLQSDDPL